jgi:hypothetical protein
MTGACEGGPKAGLAECLFVNLDCPQRRFRSGDLKRVQCMLRAPRRRHFRANDVDGSRPASLDALGDFRQGGRALRGNLVGQRDRLPRASHAGIEM